MTRAATAAICATLALLLGVAHPTRAADPAAPAGTPARPDGSPAAAPTAADVDVESEKVLTKSKSKWEDYLADWSGATISASGMLGLEGEAITTIDNKRSLTVALQGLLDDDSGNAFGLALTPARSSLAPMNLSSYASHWYMRLLGSLTLSYAQGATTIEAVDYDRKAYAVDTNFFFDRRDDPAVAYALGFASCNIFRTPTPTMSRAEFDAELAAGVEEPARHPNADGSASADDIRARAAECRDGVEKLVNDRWNRSQLSVAYGAARIQPKDHSKPEDSLGKTLAVTLVYSFGKVGPLPGIDMLSKKFALTLNYRRSTDEPVLETLAAAQTTHKDSSLFIGRLTGGSGSARVFVEFSDARSREITASQRAFKRAVGLDYRLYEGAWLNLRVGKQRKVDGTDDETGTLFSVSVSPEALLKR